MEELKEALYELRQRKLLMITAIVALVLIIGSIIFIPTMQKNIRAAQVESLVAGPIKSEKVSVLDTKQQTRKSKKQEPCQSCLLNHLASNTIKW